MATVTYKSQPAIHKTRGTIPQEGTKHPYTISKLLWPTHVEGWIATRLVGYTLHICHGKSQIGDVHLDLFEKQTDIHGDAAKLPFDELSFDTVLIDPPYNGVFQWNHDMLSELARVAKKRIVFQHWFMPVDRYGRFKKSHRFRLKEISAWQGQAYFGRAQLITVMEAV